ncbi:maltase [Xylogone sp. PMI_703]|nr:maltase [Xylogone sp. PMI_703]
MTARRKWWKDGVVYQIYPASFKDSNNDGIGDIPGIISKLDYIKSLGVDIIWVCPFYKSPQIDMGYDIADYEDIHAPYGTLTDVEELIHGCHERGMKVIFDLVINHTSSLHPWFQESRKSKDSPKRDWYIWRPAKYDKDGKRMPPNNWRSHFSGSAWTWDEATQEYYLHLFASEQPDLNWENPETRKAIYESSMLFWLEKGVDGFRVDTVNMYSKDPSLPDAPVLQPEKFDQLAVDLFCNGPRMFEYLREMNEVMKPFDVMTVGELPNTPEVDRVLAYVSAKEERLNMVFNFDAVYVGQGSDARFNTYSFTLADFKKALSKWQKSIIGNDAWTTAFLENHDQGRSISRFASDAPEHRDASGKLLAILTTCLTGTLYIYQGQEIGMINMPKSWPIEEYKCIKSVNHYAMVKKLTNGDPVALAKALRGIQEVGRDHARTPMQWNSSPNAGFTGEGVKPWMRVHDEYPSINVEKQSSDPKSILSFWKQMVKLRKENADLLIYGDYEVYDVENVDTFIFSKSYDGRYALVVLNFTAKEQKFENPIADKGALELLVSNAEDPVDGLTLSPYEGRVYLVK